ncbi:MAG TPA: hypothetical protein DCE41_03115 [Cytophagales bacterium]|nr:hypothetical protein [Cytophagales bacterium]HAA24235.1 hypothetical protein [Cytophagales bacterium]HAP59181.1 hypothetical protein [Cytophagales bacterium]
MKIQTWNSIEDFLEENDLEFVHVDTDEEYQKEVDEIQKENGQVLTMLEGRGMQDRGCKRWKPIKRRVCRMVNGRYHCEVHTRYVCVER